MSQPLHTSKKPQQGGKPKTLSKQSSSTSTQLNSHDTAAKASQSMQWSDLVKKSVRIKTEKSDSFPPLQQNANFCSQLDPNSFSFLDTFRRVIIPTTYFGQTDRSH
jgi:hypothetical protein